MGKKVLVALGMAALLGGCAPKKALNKFSDPVYITIAEYQDRRLTDSLYQFFTSPNAQYRSAAALAFASIQDTLASHGLGNLLLEDTSIQVRTSAAFALGQTGGVAAVNALIPAVNDSQSTVVREVLEALGKSITLADLNVLKTYRARDTLVEAGLAWAFYRLGLRGIVDSVMIDREEEYLKEAHTLSTRLAAAHFFNRSPLTGSSFAQQLIQTALHDVSAEVRMAAAGGLKKVDPHPALDAVKTILESDPDDRVRVNAVRACVVFPWKDSQALMLLALRDSSVAVQRSASELILKRAKESPFQGIRKEIAECTDSRVIANLYGALLSSMPDDHIVQEIMNRYRTSDDYAKSDLLTALSFSQGGNEEPAFRFIAAEILGSKIPVIKSTGALALADMNRHVDFFKKMKASFVEVYQRAVAEGDPGVVGIFSGVLGDSTLGYKAVITDFTFLYEAKKKLRLPKDIESLQPVENAIAYFEGRKPPPPLKNTFNHPVDWKRVALIDKDQRVTVKTTRGDIVLRLCVEEAPGSVANFVNLVTATYYDGRFYHRVVPNFVIQTGCNRGDGFGSEDYSIRSEFSLRRYRTGSVGMASAGKDTEGTQWFITHSPTPHLDGRYTVFAEVEAGLDVLDHIQVGDQNKTVRLVNN